MTKKEWLQKLETEMTRIGVLNRSAILADYQEHFEMGQQEGLREEDLTAKLGDPRTIAKAHLAESLITRAEASGSGTTSSMGAAFRVLVLTPFNFLMIFGPFLITAVFLLTGWFLCFVFGVMSLVALVLTGLALPFLFFNFWGAGAFLFASLGFTGFTVLGFMTMALLTKLLIRLFVSYVKWNINFVLEK